MKSDEPQKNSAEDKRAMLLGLGLDGKQGERRLTVGKNFFLTGGSEDTHSVMQEKAIKFNEELDRRKKRLEDVTPQEFQDIAERIRMRE
jgi:hypothetical protein